MLSHGDIEIDCPQIRAARKVPRRTRLILCQKRPSVASRGLFELKIPGEPAIVQSFNGGVIR